MGDTCEWELAHHEITRLARDRAMHEHALGRALLRAKRAKAWEPMGLGTLYEYTERYAGLSFRQTEERIRVAEALEYLPLLSAALAEGVVHFSAVREITRVAVPETESAWVIAAKALSVGQIERMVRRKIKGDHPDDPDRPEANRHRIVLEVSPQTYAAYREAQAKLREDSDERLSEEDGLLLMARSVLQGPSDEGRSSYQVLVTRCDDCKRTTMEGHGRNVFVDETVAETVDCDAQRIDDAGKAKQDIPPATRRLVMRRHGGKSGVPSCQIARYLDIHHVVFRSDGGTHDPDRLCPLCSAHHARVHEGTLCIDGTYSKGFSFRHADGSPYGGAAHPHIAAILADVQSALKNLGVKQRAARTIVETIGPRVGGASGNLEKEDARPS
jgi:hypothetical protein